MLTKLFMAPPTRCSPAPHPPTHPTWFSASSLWYTHDTSGERSRSPTNAKVFMLRLHAWTCGAGEEGREQGEAAQGGAVHTSVWPLPATSSTFCHTCWPSTSPRRKRFVPHAAHPAAPQMQLQAAQPRRTCWPSTSPRRSSTLKLARRSTQPGFTSGWLTYTLKLQAGLGEGGVEGLVRRRGAVRARLRAEGQWQCEAQLGHQMADCHALVPAHCCCWAARFPALPFRLPSQHEVVVHSRVEGDEDALVKDHG